jgi:hypothetical protein
VEQNGDHAMNPDENEFAHLFERLKIDDAPRPEHREALREQVLETYDRVTEPTPSLRGEQSELDREKGERLLAFFRLRLVSTATDEEGPRRDPGREQEASPSVASVGDIEIGKRLLGFFGLGVAS